MSESELYIRRGKRDNFREIFFLFLNVNICCDPSVELSWQDGSNQGCPFKVKVKVSHSLIAVGAVGVRVPLYLGHS